MLAEMVLMVTALPFLKSQKLNSISLPNVLNFGFDYHVFIQVWLVATSADKWFHSHALAAHPVIRLKSCCSVVILLQQGT